MTGNVLCDIHFLSLQLLVVVPNDISSGCPLTVVRIGCRHRRDATATRGVAACASAVTLKEGTRLTAHTVLQRFVEPMGPDSSQKPAVF